MKIPLVDLKAQYQAIHNEILPAIHDVLEAGEFINGKYVAEFENSFARSIGAQYCIGVGNGTDALFIAMKSLGVGPGDEVITAANSFIATSEAITMCGAKVVFADVDPETYNINTAIIEEKITSKTRAIIPVHLYGQPADMDPILELAKKYGLYVVEDAAQAHYAAYKERIAGTIGEAGCFSFYPGKNLGAYGDAGAIVTNNERLASKIRMMANHGRVSKYDHEFEGVNSRMDAVQGAVLNVKLKHMHSWTTKRQDAADLYTGLLKNIAGIVTPVVREYAKHVYHLYVIRAPFRNKLQDFLRSKGIATGVHYPKALPNLLAYKYLDHTATDFPVASKNEGEILSLPIYPELTVEQIEYIVNCIRTFFHV